MWKVIPAAAGEQLAERVGAEEGEVMQERARGGLQPALGSRESSAHRQTDQRTPARGHTDSPYGAPGRAGGEVQGGGMQGGKGRMSGLYWAALQSGPSSGDAGGVGAGFLRQHL